MRSNRGTRGLRTVAILGISVLVVGCVSGSDEALDKTSTTATDRSSTTAPADGLDIEFTSWFNDVTAADAVAPTCHDGAPAWIATDSIKPSSSGPLLICADRSPNDELVLRVVNNASGPLAIEYPDAAAAWSATSDEPSSIIALPGGAGTLIRPGEGVALTAAAMTWSEQELTLTYPARWAIVEATNAAMASLGIDNTFEWATDLAESCEVDDIADADLGAPLEAGLNDYFNCVFDSLGDAADEDDRAALADVVPLVVQLVEQSHNVASQQRAGSVDAALLIASELPEPAGPVIEETTTTVAAQPPATRPPTTRPPTTRPPTTAAPATPAPTTETTVPAPSKVPTTQEDPGLTVPLPPAPVLVALETISAGVDAYTSWPAIDPKLSRLTGGQIVVIECRAFTETKVSGGNGWWYRIGSGDASGGWASATGFKNLVSGIEPGSTASTNVSDALASC